MLSIKQLITELNKELETSTNETLLLAFIDKHLVILRSQYRENKAEFNDETIKFLKSLSVLQDSLHDFIDAIDDKNWLKTQDDGHELASRFGELKDRFAPYLIAKRAEKELRETVEMTKLLPLAITIKTENNFHKLRTQLEKNAKPCLKCGNKMVLRKSQHGYFWGCSTFPECFSRRWLTNEEVKKIFPDNTPNS